MQYTTYARPRARKVSQFSLLLCLLLLPYQCDSYTEVFSIAKDSDDNTYVVGNRDSNFFIGKKSGSCSLEWESTAGSTSGDDNKAVNSEVLYDAVIGQDGVVYAVGSTPGNFSSPSDEVPNLDAAVLVYDSSNGNVVRQEQYDIATDLDNVAQAVSQKVDGNLLVAVYGSVPNIESIATYETRILEIDSQSLEVKSIHEIDITTTENSFSVTGGPKVLDFTYEESSDSIIALGHILGRGMVWKYSLATGTTTAQVEWGEAFGNFQISSFTSDGSGAYFIAGSSSERVLENADLLSTVNTEFHAYVIRYDNLDSSPSSATWVRQLAGGGSSQSGNSIAIDPVTGDVVVVGDFDADFTVTDAQTSETFTVNSVADDGITDVFLWYLDPSTGNFKELRSSSVASTDAEDRGNAVYVLSTRTVQIGGITNDGNDDTATVCDIVHTLPSPAPSTSPIQSFTPSRTPLTSTPSNSVSPSISRTSTASPTSPTSPASEALSSPEITTALSSAPSSSKTPTPSESQFLLAETNSASPTPTLTAIHPSSSFAVTSSLAANPSDTAITASVSAPAPSTSTITVQSPDISGEITADVSSTPTGSAALMVSVSSSSPSAVLPSAMLSSTSEVELTTLEPTMSDMSDVTASSSPAMVDVLLNETEISPSSSMMNTGEATLPETTTAFGQELEVSQAPDVTAVETSSSLDTDEIAPSDVHDSSNAVFVSFQSATTSSSSSPFPSAFELSSTSPQAIVSDEGVSPTFAFSTISMGPTPIFTPSVSDTFTLVDLGTPTPSSSQIPLETGAIISSSETPVASSGFILVGLNGSLVPSTTSAPNAIDVNFVSPTPSSSMSLLVLNLETASADSTAESSDFPRENEAEEGLSTGEPNDGRLGASIGPPGPTALYMEEDTGTLSGTPDASAAFSEAVASSVTADSSPTAFEATVEVSLSPKVPLAPTMENEDQVSSSNPPLMESTLDEFDENPSATESKEALTTSSMPSILFLNPSVLETYFPTPIDTPNSAVLEASSGPTFKALFTPEEMSNESDEVPAIDLILSSPSSSSPVTSATFESPEASPGISEVESITAVPSTILDDTIFATETPTEAVTEEIQPSAFDLEPSSATPLASGAPSPVPMESTITVVLMSSMPSASSIFDEAAASDTMFPGESPEHGLGEPTSLARPSLQTIASTREAQGDQNMDVTPSPDEFGNEEESLRGSPIASHTAQPNEFEDLMLSSQSPELEITQDNNLESSMLPAGVSNTLGEGLLSPAPSLSSSDEIQFHGIDASRPADTPEASTSILEVLPTTSMPLKDESEDLDKSSAPSQETNITDPTAIGVSQTVDSPSQARPQLPSTAPETSGAVTMKPMTIPMASLSFETGENEGFFTPTTGLDTGMETTPEGASVTSSETPSPVFSPGSPIDTPMETGEFTFFSTNLPSLIPDTGENSAPDDSRSSNPSESAKPTPAQESPSFSMSITPTSAAPRPSESAAIQTPTPTKAQVPREPVISVIDIGSVPGAPSSRPAVSGETISASPGISFIDIVFASATPSSSPTASRGNIPTSPAVSGETISASPGISFIDIVFASATPSSSPAVSVGNIPTSPTVSGETISASPGISFIDIVFASATPSPSSTASRGTIPTSPAVSGETISASPGISFIDIVFASATPSSSPTASRGNIPTSPAVSGETISASPGISFIDIVFASATPSSSPAVSVGNIPTSPAVSGETISASPVISFTDIVFASATPSSSRTASRGSVPASPVVSGEVISASPVSSFTDVTLASATPSSTPPASRGSVPASPVVSGRIISASPVSSFTDVILASPTPSSSPTASSGNIPVSPVVSEATVPSVPIVSGGVLSTSPNASVEAVHTSPSVTSSPFDGGITAFPSATPSPTSRTSTTVEPSSTALLISQSGSASPVAIPVSSNAIGTSSQAPPSTTPSISTALQTPIASQSAPKEDLAVTSPSQHVSESPSISANVVPVVSTGVSFSKAPIVSASPSRKVLVSSRSPSSETQTRTYEPSIDPAIDGETEASSNAPKLSEEPDSSKEAESSLLPSTETIFEEPTFSLLPSPTYDLPAPSGTVDEPTIPGITQEMYITNFPEITGSTEAEEEGASGSPAVIPTISDEAEESAFPSMVPSFSEILSPSLQPTASSTLVSTPMISISGSPSSSVSPTVTCEPDTSVLSDPDALNRTRNFQRVNMVIQVAGPDLTNTCQFTAIISDTFILLSAINTLSQFDMWHITSIEDGPPVFEEGSSLVAIEQEDITDTGIASITPSPSSGTGTRIRFPGSVRFNVTAFMNPLSVELASGSYVEYIDSQNIVKAMTAEGFDDIKWTGMVVAPNAIDERVLEEDTGTTAAGLSSGEVSALAIGSVLVVGVAGFVIVEGGLWTKNSGPILPI